MDVIIRTPRKLNIAAIMMALDAFIDLVETHVAIALGASVHPFTRITPSVNSTVTISKGLLTDCEIKSGKLIIIDSPTYTMTFFFQKPYDSIILNFIQLVYQDSAKKRISMLLYFKLIDRH